MRFFRVTSPGAVGVLIPWFVPTENQTRRDIFVELYDRLCTQAEDMFVLLAMEGWRILGFLAAYKREYHDRVPHPERNNPMYRGPAYTYFTTSDVYAWQARSEGLASKYVDMAVDGMCQWAKGRGVSRIATTPNRAIKLFKRRWGFEQIDESGEIYKEL